MHQATVKRAFGQKQRSSSLHQHSGPAEGSVRRPGRTVLSHEKLGLGRQPSEIFLQPQGRARSKNESRGAWRAAFRCRSAKPLNGSMAAATRQYTPVAIARIRRRAAALSRPARSHTTLRSAAYGDAGCSQNAPNSAPRSGRGGVVSLCREKCCVVSFES